MTWHEDRARRVQEAIEAEGGEPLLPLTALLLLAGVILLVLGRAG